MWHSKYEADLYAVLREYPKLKPLFDRYGGLLSNNPEAEKQFMCLAITLFLKRYQEDLIRRLLFLIQEAAGRGLIRFEDPEDPFKVDPEEWWKTHG